MSGAFFCEKNRDIRLPKISALSVIVKLSDRTKIGAPKPYPDSRAVKNASRLTGMAQAESVLRGAVADLGDL